MKKIMTIYLGIIGLTIITVKLLHIIFDIELLWLYPVAIVAATIVAFIPRKAKK